MQKCHDEKNIIQWVFLEENVDFVLIPPSPSTAKSIFLSLAKSTYKNKSLLQKKIFFYSTNKYNFIQCCIEYMIFIVHIFSTNF